MKIEIEKAKMVKIEIEKIKIVRILWRVRVKISDTSDVSNTPSPLTVNTL